MRLVAYPVMRPVTPCGVPCDAPCGIPCDAPDYTLSLVMSQPCHVEGDVRLGTYDLSLAAPRTMYGFARTISALQRRERRTAWRLASGGPGR